MQDYDNVIPIGTQTATGPMATVCGNVSTGCGRNNDQTATPRDVRRPWQTVTSLWLNTRLDPYVKNYQVWMCPSLGLGPVNATSQEVGYISSLAWTLSVGRVCLMNTPESALLLTPAEIPMFGDVISYQTPSYIGCRLISMAGYPLGSHHNDQVNVSFLDGHVKSMQVQNYWKMANDSYNGVAGKTWK